MPFYYQVDSLLGALIVLPLLAQFSLMTGLTVCGDFSFESVTLSGRFPLTGVFAFGRLTSMGDGLGFSVAGASAKGSVSSNMF